MNLFSFDAINRRTYISISVLLGFISIATVYNGLKSLSNNHSEIMLPVVSLFLLVNIILDYKRIKDITPNQYYLLFLVIPIIFGVFSLLMQFNINIINTFLSTEYSLFITIIGFIYKTILLFKKGYIRNTNNVVS